MIFATGFCCFLIGAYMQRVLVKKLYGKLDVAGAFIAYVGLGTMVTSICMLCSRYLP
jgi:hypothetical protein